MSAQGPATPAAGVRQGLARNGKGAGSQWPWDRGAAQCNPSPVGTHVDNTAAKIELEELAHDALRHGARWRALAQWLSLSRHATRRSRRRLFPNGAVEDEGGDCTRVLAADSTECASCAAPRCSQRLRRLAASDSPPLTRFLREERPEERKGASTASERHALSGSEASPGAPAMHVHSRKSATCIAAHARASVFESGFHSL
jgi:hypothetical protein